MPHRLWSRQQRWLHWSSAVLVLATIALALMMVRIPLSMLVLKFTLYQWHKTLGLTVLALTLWRLGVRLWRGRPAWEAGLPVWQQRAAMCVHAMLYAALLLMPVLGYLMVSTAPLRVPTLFAGIVQIPHLLGPDPTLYALLRAAHRLLGFAVLAMVVLHAMAALHNHRQGLHSLRQMWRGL